MHTSKISRQVLQEYNEMVQDTVYNLELHLQRIDDRWTQLNTENINTSGTMIDLKDEREVVKQCLRICEDARSYITSLSDRESSLLPETHQQTVDERAFEAQRRTRQALNENRDSFAETIGYLRDRLELLIQGKGHENESERSRLQADIEVSKQCIDVCKLASEISQQKVYTIGEAIAEGDSDQVVVTTMADLFDVKKVLSRDRSAQLIGSMPAENLRYLTEKRYDSRFGTVAGHTVPNEAGSASSPSALEDQGKRAFTPSSGNHDQHPNPKATRIRPSPNEMRKRFTEDVTD